LSIGPRTVTRNCRKKPQTTKQSRFTRHGRSSVSSFVILESPS
jgi:hypothetical protein